MAFNKDLAKTYSMIPKDEIYLIFCYICISIAYGYFLCSKCWREK